MLSGLIDSLAAFLIIVWKPFTPRILKKLFYQPLDLSVFVEKSNAFMFSDPFYVFFDFFVSWKFIFSCSLNLHVDMPWVIYHSVCGDLSKSSDLKIMSLSFRKLS